MKIIAIAALALAGAASAGVVARTGANAKTIAVTEQEFRITLSTHKAQVGRVTFVIRNKGKYTHALAISGPGMKTKKTASIRPGKRAKLVVTLHSGTYTLWCPVPGHAAQGMKASLTVPGSATTAGGSGGGGYGGSTTTDSTTTSGAPWG